MNKTTVTAERWLPIPGYEGLYEVSDQGRVRSLGRIGRNGQTYPAKVLKLAQSKGYRLSVLTALDGSRTTHRVHLLVMAAFVGPREEGMVCRHLDGNPANNVLSNLAYGTPVENAADMIAHGTHHSMNVTHCPQGHPYDEANTMLYTAKNRGVQRRCKTCNRERAREGMRRLKERRAAEAA